MPDSSSDDRQRTGAESPVLSAVIFDVDGTLADTERDGHRPAFNAAFAAHGLDIFWNVEEYGRLLKITGGRRRIAADLRARGFGDAAADQLAAEIHQTKTQLFRDRIVAGDVVLRPGLPALVRSLVDQGIRLAVATTGRRAWVEPLLKHFFDLEIFEVIVTGDDVSRLKPDPEVYRQTLEKLELRPEEVLAIEDSTLGLHAAMACNIATVVVTTDYSADQDMTGAAAVRSSYEGIDPLLASSCERIHRQWWTNRHRGSSIPCGVGTSENWRPRR